MSKLSPLMLALPILAGCRSSGAFEAGGGSLASKIPVADAAKVLSTPGGQQLCTGVNDLGFTLLRSLSQSSAQQNICISPTSVSLAIGMTRNGAKGDTETCISEALGVKGMDRGSFTKDCLNLAALFEGADPKIELNIANSIWVMPGIELEPGFVDTSRQFYDASVANADLASGAGLKTVNDWVKAKTKGKIPAILDSAQLGSAMVLLDAVYFKGPWKDPFDKKATDEEPFHCANETTKNASMMRRMDGFSYSRSGGSQLLSIPYQGQRLAMLIYLPDQDVPLTDVISSANAQNWSQGIADMHRDLVAVRMPKFSVKFSASLKNSLSAAGMSRAFSSGLAEFSGISKSPMFISDVLHKTTTDVGEEGTVATAATAVVMGLTSAMPPQEPPKPIDFIADHPFLYAIYDTQSKAILFVGVLYDP